MTSSPLKLQVTLRDAYGTLIETFTDLPAAAASRVQEFLLVHGSDPERQGAAAMAGRVEFAPVTEAA